MKHRSVKRKIISRDEARKALQRAIKVSGLTQAAFARKIGDHDEAISLALHGHRGLSRRMLKQLGMRRVVGYERRSGKAE